MCVHLAGHDPPRGPQIPPSQARSTTQKEEEVPTTSLHPSARGSGTTPHSNSTSPMETGGAGDGRSWAEQTEAQALEEWKSRPPKCCRMWEAQSMNPFPLQDSE